MREVKLTGLVAKQNENDRLYNRDTRKGKGSAGLASGRCGRVRISQLDTQAPPIRTLDKISFGAAHRRRRELPLDEPAEPGRVLGGSAWLLDAPPVSGSDATS